MEELEKKYFQRFQILQPLSTKIEILLKDVLKDHLSRIDIVSVRAKSLDKFLGKARRDGKSYENPLIDIQDQIGARIIVKFLSDRPVIEKRIKQYFHTRENVIKEAETYNQFDYEAHHIICVLPIPNRPNITPPIEVFELQISTLFQHAWAEANHDIGYKQITEVNNETKRKLAWLAAQAWGADKMFDEIYRNVNNLLDEQSEKS